MEKFYDYYARCNANYNMYIKISIKHYLDAKLFYDYLCQEQSNFLSNNNWITESLVVSETFVAFAIESFFNDYIAICFGDEVFFKQYVMLSAIQKLQLISEKKFNKLISQDDEVYKTINKVFLLRDKYAHNKSSDIFTKFKEQNIFSIISLEDQRLEYSDKYIDDNIIIKKAFSYSKKHLLGDMNNALESLIALAKLSYYIDDNDDEINAKVKFFRFISDDIDNAYEKTPTQFINDIIDKLYHLIKSNNVLKHMAEKIDSYNKIMYNYIDK